MMDTGQFCIQVSPFTTLQNFATDKTSLGDRISVESSAILDCYYRVRSDIALQFFRAEAGRCVASYSLYMWAYTEFDCHM